MPPNGTSRRAELVEAIAAIVLEHGLDALALRGLAARLSTSGRMLLYHFGTKDALVRAVLAGISERMAVLQAAAAPGAPEDAGTGLRRIRRLLGNAGSGGRGRAGHPGQVPP